MTRISLLPMLIRCGLLIGALLWSIGGSLGVPLWAAVLGALVASDGMVKETFVGGVILSLALELVLGWPVGSIVLAWIGVTTLLFLARRIIMIPAWRERRGWTLQGIGWAVVVAMGITALLTAAVIGTVWVFDNHTLVSRFSTAFSGRSILIGTGVVLGVLVILRWSDEPFRKKIIFGHP